MSKPTEKQDVPSDRKAGKGGLILPLSVPRRLSCDLLHFAAGIPTVPVQRQMRLAAIQEQRGRMASPPSWLALFLKAFGLAAVQFPPLRQAYLSLPRPRLYEHPFSIASVSFEKDYQGEKAVVFGQIGTPEGQRLHVLDEDLRRLNEAPIEEFAQFRSALRTARLPGFLRRFMWWIGLNASGADRSRRLGTFGVSDFSDLGAESLHPLSPLTTTLNFGVVGSDGRVMVRIVYDHRVMDGATVALALGRMEQALQGEILAEMKEKRLEAA
jgi:hypothetical protein